MYLRFVSGRSTLPGSDIQFTHKVASITNNNDNLFPVGSTCFFTLKIPDYSSYEIFKEKLKYAIYECKEIDNDFYNRDAININDD